MKPYLKAKKELIANGYYSKRNTGGHEIFFNPELRCSIPLKRHDFDEDDLRYILKEIKQNKNKSN